MQLIGRFQQPARKILRTRGGRTAAAFACFALAALIYFELNSRQWVWYERASAQGRCRSPDATLENLTKLAQKVNAVLNRLEVKHFLLYGSYIGALRYGDILPWDTDLDFGVTAESMGRYQMSELETAFAEEDLKISYASWGGFYRIESPQYEEKADIMVFDTFYGDGFYHRVGIESYVFFVNYRYYHKFPARLLQEPLPTLRFAGRNMTVPRGGFEILKYHYPHNWDREVRPAGC